VPVGQAVFGVKFQLSASTALEFKAYGTDYVDIGNHRHTTAILLLPDAGVVPWSALSFAAINNDSWAQVIDENPEVFLLGTGTQQRFIHPKHTQALLAAGIAVECMNLGALCRTFNILRSEDRRVAAAIVFQ
jgi:uncharacterized protein